MQHFFSHFRTLWTQPKQTMRMILSGDNPEWFILLLMLSPLIILGILGVALGPSFGIGNAQVLSTLGMIALVQIICLYLFGFLVHLLSNWLCGGTGTAKTCRIAMAWSIIPSVVFMAIISLTAYFAPAALVIVYPLGMIWLLIITFNYLAVGNGLVSGWQAVGMMYTSAAVFVFIVFAIAIVLGMAFGNPISFTKLFTPQGMHYEMMDGYEHMDNDDIMKMLEGMEGLEDLDFDTSQ